MGGGESAEDEAQPPKKVDASERHCFDNRVTMELARGYPDLRTPYIGSPKGKAIPDFSSWQPSPVLPWFSPKQLFSPVLWR